MLKYNGADFLNEMFEFGFRGIITVVRHRGHPVCGMAALERVCYFQMI